MAVARSMKKRFSITLYNLPQFLTLVGSIRHGRRIEGCERDYKILPCILPYRPATKRLFNFAPSKISASQTDALAKLEAEACPFSGQVVMGRISLVPFFFRKRKTLGNKPKTKVMDYKICPYILPCPCFSCSLKST